MKEAEISVGTSVAMIAESEVECGERWPPELGS
jgi:hypothetical protein